MSQQNFVLGKAMKRYFIIFILYLIIGVILACPHKNPNPVVELEYFFPPK